MKKCIACGVLLCLLLTACAIGTTTPTATTPTTGFVPSTCGLLPCYAKEHTYENGRCIYCNATEPVDVDARLIVNGKDITAGNYVKINEDYNNASIPLTAVLTELGIPWEWESDTILRIGSGEYEERLDLTQPTFDWLIPPGTLGSIREIVDGEVIIDAQALYIYFFRAQNISIERDYDTHTIRIERKTPTENPTTAQTPTTPDLDTSIKPTVIATTKQPSTPTVYVEYPCYVLGHENVNGYCRYCGGKMPE